MHIDVHFASADLNHETGERILMLHKPGRIPVLNRPGYDLALYVAPVYIIIFHIPVAAGNLGFADHTRNPDLTR